MWTARRRRWLSLTYDVRDARRETVGVIVLSLWPDRARILAEGVEHRVARRGFLGPYVLTRGGGPLASAEAGRTLRIEQEGRRYSLARRSFWRRELVLRDGEREVGSVAPEDLFATRLRASLPDDLSPPLGLFVVCLSLLLWRRELDG